MSFLWPWALFSFLLVPIIVWAYFFLRQQRRLRQNEWAEIGLRPIRPIAQNERPRQLPAALYLVGFMLLLLALARPEATVRLPRIEGTVILAFDVSASMAADDFAPDRMTAAKEAARVFIEEQPPSILIGIVAFSSGGLVITPPTADRVELLAAIDRLSPQGGTSLGQGIFSSLNAVAGEPIDLGASLEESQLESDGDLSQLLSEGIDIGYFPAAVIILLTDGENTAGSDPLAMAQLAADAGVRIYPVGLGSEEGAIIEVDGFQILTRLNGETLNDIARLTNGTYFEANSEDQLIDIYENIDLQLTLRGEKTEITAVFAAAALFFFIVGLLLSMVWFKRIL